MSRCARSSTESLVTTPRVVGERLRRNDSSCIKTTLYELITAVQESVGPDDDTLVVAIVSNILGDRRRGSVTP